jgi:hypothetical protein
MSLLITQKEKIQINISPPITQAEKKKNMNVSSYHTKGKYTKMYISSEHTSININVSSYHTWGKKYKDVYLL